jgi:hypothetical protein
MAALITEAGERLVREHLEHNRIPPQQVGWYRESVGDARVRLALRKDGAAWRITIAADGHTPATLWVGGSHSTAMAVLGLLLAEMEESPATGVDSKVS